jgi:hypothetical protein
MNITTNTLLMTGANRCIDRRLVNVTLRRGAKKNFYVALMICAIGWAHGTSFPQATLASVGPHSQTTSPAPSGQQDFDFHFGTWETHNLLVAHPLSGPTTWIELDGTVTVRGRFGMDATIWRRSSPVTLRPLPGPDPISLQSRIASVESDICQY